MGRKELNPADVYRKQQRKKDLKKCKENRSVIRSVQELLSDPNKIEEEIQKAQKESDGSQLDRGLKDRVKELKMMKSVAITKQKIDIASGKADRDAAAQLKESELLLRNNRRSLKSDEPFTASQRGNADSLSTDRRSQETLRNDQQSIYENPGDAQTASLGNQIPQPIAIAPMLGINSISAPIFARPPPPPPPLFRLPDSNLQKKLPLVPSLQLTTNIAQHVGDVFAPLPPMPPPRYFTSTTDLPLSGVDNKTTSDLSSSYMPTVDEVATSGSEATALSIVPSQFLFSVEGFVMPSAADLMKRRHALADETDTATVRYENSTTLDDSFVPAYPHFGLFQPLNVPDEPLPYSFPAPFEGDRDRVQAPRDSIEIKKCISLPPPRAMISGGLGGLAEYGSDSDDDDDDDGNYGISNEINQSSTNTTVHQRISTFEVPIFVPRSFPLHLVSYSELDQPVGSSATLSISALDSSVINPLSSQAAQEQQIQEGHPIRDGDDDMVAFFKSVEQNKELQPLEQAGGGVPIIKSASIPSSIHNNQKPYRKPALKSIRPDSALTAFLPSALRIKRPILYGGQDPMTKVPKLQDGSDSAISASSISSSSNVGDRRTVGPQGIGGGVEDAYLNFLDEIGELTGSS